VFLLQANKLIDLVDEADPSVGYCYSNGDSQMVAGIQGLHLGDPVELD
jgi:hypothetical protein